MGCGNKGPEVDHQSRSTSLTKQFELTLSDSWVPFITLLVGLGINEKFEYGRDIRTTRCNRSDPPLLLRDQTLTFNLFVVVVLRHSRTSGIAAALRRFHAYWNLPHFQVHFISNHCILFSFSLFDRVSLLVPPHAQCSYFLFVRKVKLEDAGRSTGTAIWYCRCRQQRLLFFFFSPSRFVVCFEATRLPPTPPFQGKAPVPARSTAPRRVSRPVTENSFLFTRGKKT